MLYWVLLTKCIDYMYLNSHNFSSGNRISKSLQLRLFEDATLDAIANK